MQCRLETYKQKNIEMPMCPKMFRNFISLKFALILEGSSSVCVLQDIFNALERIGLGLEKKDAVMSEKKRKLVAYHEAGALVGSGWCMPLFNHFNLTQHGASRSQFTSKDSKETHARACTDTVHSTQL